MAHNKLYRNFMILQADEKALSGYAKIEAKGDKCKISFYAQNLDKDQKYLMVLICYKKDMKQIVDLGPILVNDGGKGEAVNEYYVNNIAGLDMSYDKISGAAICKDNDNKLDFIMYGFMNGEHVKDDWKKCKFVKHQIEKKEIKEEIKEKKQHKEEHKEAIIEEHKEKIEHKEEFKEEIKEKKEIKEESKEKVQEKIEHIREPEEKDDVIKESTIGKPKECEACKICTHIDREDNSQSDVNITDFDEYETRIEREKDLNPFDFELRGGVGEYFNEVSRSFEEIKNRFKDIKFCKWYRVSVNNIEDLCNTSNYNRYTIVYNPMLNYYPYIKKYDHFMIGYKCDNTGELKYLVYAVPGTRNIDDQPYMGKTGFVTWMRSGDDMYNEDELGYWLMFYDYKNSVVVVPMR